jgi:hypothetical protein
MRRLGIFFEPFSPAYAKHWLRRASLVWQIHFQTHLIGEGGFYEMFHFYLFIFNPVCFVSILPLGSGEGGHA